MFKGCQLRQFEVINKSQLSQFRVKQDINCILSHNISEYQPVC